MKQGTPFINTSERQQCSLLVFLHDRHMTESSHVIWPIDFLCFSGNNRTHHRFRTRLSLEVGIVQPGDPPRSTVPPAVRSLLAIAQNPHRSLPLNNVTCLWNYPSWCAEVPHPGSCLCWSRVTHHGMVSRVIVVWPQMDGVECQSIDVVQCSLALELEAYM